MKRSIKNLPSAILLIAFALSATVVFAQSKSISGRVISEKDNLPLIGVSVSVKGKQNNTLTNSNGEFNITVDQNNAVIIFSYLGFKSIEKPIPTNGSLNIVLKEDLNALNEVVVVGYGTQKKSDVTGAVASIPKERLNDLPNTNIAQALQGAVPGLSIEQVSTGAEGDQNAIRIRGRNSITAGQSPLIVLDGVPYGGSLSDINPPDIESITVLKDASSAAIYGSRGANGVIIVTTKKGTKGKPVISYDGFYGVQNVSNVPDYLTPDEFYDFKKLREPATITASEQAIYDAKNYPNWVDLVTRQGQITQHTLGVNGGGENSRYYVSGTYLGVKGVAVNDDFKRISTRINVESNVKEWLTFGSNSQLLYSDKSGLPASFDGAYGAYVFNPLTTAYNPDGSPTIYPWPEDTFFQNPLAPTLAKNQNETYKIITNNYLNVDMPFIKGLSYRINTGVEFTGINESTYYGLNTKTGLQAKGQLGITSSNNKNLLLENIVNYNRTFDKHNISFTGLYSFQNLITRNDATAASGFPNDVLTYYQANVATTLASAAVYQKQTLISQMARLNYAYNSKYLLTLTARRDGFSGFGANNKYGFFPSVALGWNVSDEDFLKENKIISSLKLRLSYGKNGNQDIGPYKTLAALINRSYVNGATTQAGYIPSTLGNPDLKWETTTSANIGLDFGILKGRIQGSLDVYSKETTDLLLQRKISSIHGITTIYQNLGATTNKGFELGIVSTNIQTKDFIWSTNFNTSLYRNKITKLYGDGKDDIDNAWFIGQPIAVNFDWLYDGVWQTTDDLTKSPQPNTKPGYAKVVDTNKDGKITADDRVIVGSRQPDFIYGIGNTFKYKNFSLYAFIQGVQGTNRRNTLLADAVQNGVRYNTVKKNWWTPTNPTNDFYAATLGNNLYNVGIFESDSYARLKDISLSYDFSSKILSQLKISRLKIYANARNLVTLTKWTGLDPELSAQDGIPLQKEFIFGLNIGL